MSSTAETKHPRQPIVISEIGTHRFKANSLVVYLLDQASKHGVDMNHLALLHFDQDDRQHFAQLIGYSVDGYADLSYHDPEIVTAADAEGEKFK